MRSYSGAFLRLISRSLSKRSGLRSPKKDGTYGPLKAPQKTDCLPITSTPPNKNTSCYDDQLSSQLIGNCENRASEKPVERWCLTTYKTVLGLRENLVEKGGGKSVGRTSGILGDAYPWFSPSAQNYGEIMSLPPLTAYESPRDFKILRMSWVIIRHFRKSQRSRWLVGLSILLKSIGVLKFGTY